MDGFYSTSGPDGSAEGAFQLNFGLYHVAMHQKTLADDEHNS